MSSFSCSDLPMCNKKKRSCVGLLHCQIKDENDYLDLTSEPYSWPQYIVKVDLNLDDTKNYSLECSYVDDESNEKIPFSLVKCHVTKKSLFGGLKVLELTTTSGGASDSDVIYLWSPSIEILEKWSLSLQKLVQMAHKREPQVTAAKDKKRKEIARKRAATQGGDVEDGVSTVDDDSPATHEGEESGGRSPSFKEVLNGVRPKHVDGHSALFKQHEELCHTAPTFKDVTKGVHPAHKHAGGTTQGPKTGSGHAPGESGGGGDDYRSHDERVKAENDVHVVKDNGRGAW